MTTKKIYDSVHGFIRFNEWESELIDSLPFQRLHYLHQLGIAYLVYPGATHTRFEHSLGVMELATRIFDQIIEKVEWKDQEVDVPYWRQIIRLAALCHDLGHLPFSHVAEAALLGKEGHERWTLEIIRSPDLKPLWEKLGRAFFKKDVVNDVIKMAVGEKKLSEMGRAEFSPWERVFCEVITGDFFGADRIDYLLRDAQCTGVAYGLFDYHQMIEMLCILPSKGKEEGNWELGIEENGIEACEALLLARYFMHKRVYQYPSVKAYSFHLSRFMKSVYQKEVGHTDLQRYLALTDNEVLTALRQAVKQDNAPGHSDAVCLSIRHKRFRAISLPWGITEENLQELKKNLNIPSEAIAWSLSQKSPGQQGLSFPVLKRNRSVVDASSCSEIHIPVSNYSWVYISPEYEPAFSLALEKVQRR